MVSKLSEIRFGLFLPDPDPDFLPIPDPGAGSRIRIRNTGFFHSSRHKCENDDSNLFGNRRSNSEVSCILHRWIIRRISIAKSPFQSNLKSPAALLYV